jgi:hypothetical protein
MGTPSVGKTGHSDPDFIAPFSQKQGVSTPSASVCEEYCELIEQGWQAQAYLDRWEERSANTRIHGTTKRQVTAMSGEEKPYLLPLPLEPSFAAYLESSNPDTSRSSTLQ